VLTSRQAAASAPSATRSLDPDAGRRHWISAARRVAPPLFAGVWIPLTLLPVAPAEEATKANQRTIPVESASDPPPARRAYDDPSARAPGLRVTTGPYTSIQINVDEAGQNIVGDAANEPSLAVNPTDPANMVVGWRQFDSISSNFRQAGHAFTTDGGQTWIFSGVLTPGVFRSDPVLDFDSFGNVYYHSLKQNFDVDLFKSFDGGMLWSGPVFAFGGDKNWMAIDRSGGIGDGNIYGTWQAAAGCCGQNIFNRSENGGQSFSAPVPVAKSPGIGTLAVGPAGEVYSAGIDETSGQDLSTLVVARSSNAKNPGSTPTFSGAVVELNGSLGFAAGPNPGGLLGQINVAVDSSGGPSNGYVYVLASVDPDAPGTNPIDVVFSRSTNGGATWSPPRRVNDDAANSGAWHWLAAFSVAPNGRIDAIWADTRNSGQVNVSELFYSYSWDHGDTWSANVPASPPFNSFLGWPQQNKIGDYYAIVSDAAGADAAYSATFNGEQDVYYIRVFPDCNGNGQSDVTDVDGPSPDCNSNMIPDECEALPGCVAAGRTPDGKLVAGTPLRIGKAPGGEISLTWGASCMPSDSDYEVYEGTLGAFASHAARVCSTAGATSFDLTPAAASSYYLIVSRNGIREGSYGRSSALVERPQGQNPCLPRQIGLCLASPLSARAE